MMKFIFKYMVVVGFIIIACGAFSLQAVAAPGYSEAEVDRMIRELDRKNLADLKKNYPDLYEEEIERIAIHRIEGTTYHYPCMCLWMGEWNWDTYKKVFKVKIPKPIMEFDLRDDAFECTHMFKKSLFLFQVADTV